jgi:hypothetical protein
MAQGSSHIFTKWQLLFAIKLLCVFGERRTVEQGHAVSPDSILQLLLMVDDFVDRDSDDQPDYSTEELQRAAVKSQVIRQMLLFDEQTRYLVGLYEDLFFHRARETSPSRTDNWIDVERVFEDRYGLSMEEFQAVVAGTYFFAMTEPVAGQSEFSVDTCFNPADWFRSTPFSEEAVRLALDQISVTPEQIRDDHVSKYGETVGQTSDILSLLSHAVLKLTETCYAPVSPRLVVKRFTNALYWDIHDWLPDEGRPNQRRLFQSMFGILIEDFGRDLLTRIEATDPEAKRLIWETDYQEPTEKTSDGLLIEDDNGRKSCTLVEFTVGRPRVTATVLTGDLSEFERDVEVKLGSAIDQQIDLLRRLALGEKEIDGLNFEEVDDWNVLLVVSDPFPAFEVLIETISQRRDALRSLGIQVTGPMVISLEELIPMETICGERSSLATVLSDWQSSPMRQQPFGNYFYTREVPNGEPFETGNDFVLARLDDAFSRAQAILLPDG